MVRRKEGRAGKSSIKFQRPRPNPTVGKWLHIASHVMFPSGAEEPASGSDGVSRSVPFTSPVEVIISDWSCSQTEPSTAAPESRSASGYEAEAPQDMS